MASTMVFCPGMAFSPGMALITQLPSSNSQHVELETRLSSVCEEPRLGPKVIGAQQHLANPCALSG